MATLMGPEMRNVTGTFQRQKTGFYIPEETSDGSIHLTLTSLGNTVTKPILKLLENILHDQFPPESIKS